VQFSTTVELSPSALHIATVIESRQKRWLGVHTVGMQPVPTQACPAGHGCGSEYWPFWARHFWIRPSLVHCEDMPLHAAGLHCPAEQVWFDEQ